MIAAAGGASVVAHPWGRSQRPALDEHRFAELRDRGLSGIEVDHPDHRPAERAELRAIAERLELLATGSSDYHGTNKLLRLGEETTSPDVLDRLVAATSGEIAPLGPVR